MAAESVACSCLCGESLKPPANLENVYTNVEGKKIVLLLNKH